MSIILKIKQFPEVEKCKIIQHLKNEIRIIGDEFKTNNIDLLIHVMNFYFLMVLHIHILYQQYFFYSNANKRGNKYIIPIFIPVVDFIIMDVELLIRLMVRSDLICFVNFFF